MLGEDIEGFSPSPDDMKTLLVNIALKFLYKTESFKQEMVNLVVSRHTNWTNPSDRNSLRIQLVKILGDVNSACLRLKWLVSIKSRHRPEISCIISHQILRMTSYQNQVGFQGLRI